MDDSSRQQLNQIKVRVGILKKPTNFFAQSTKPKINFLDKRVKFNQQDLARSLQFTSSRVKSRLNEQQSALSKWTLKPRDSLIRQEFNAYRHRQIRSYARILYPVKLSVGLVALVCSFIAREENESIFVQSALLFGVPAFVCTIFVALSYKRAAVVEILTPLTFFVYASMLLLVNSTSVASVSLKQFDRQIQITGTMIQYAISAHYIGGEWLVQMVLRVMLLLLTLISLMLYRQSVGDEIGIGQALMITIFTIVLVEISMYNHVRAQADLFVKIKLVERQEAQLSDLLNNVPDSVLICTNPTELRASRGVYANFKMNSFFGRDVINYIPEQKTSSKAIRGIKAIPELRKTRNPLKQRIFELQDEERVGSEFSNPFKGDLENQNSVEMRLSLLEIVQKERDRNKRFFEANIAEYMSEPKSDSNGQRILKATCAGLNAENKQEVKTVTIKVLDVLFDGQACSLVYIQDVTELVLQSQKEKNVQNMLLANACVTEELQVPQQNIINLTEKMISTGEQSNREPLQVIQFETRLMQLLVMNLTDFQNLKHQAFTAHETRFNVASAVKEIIDIHQVDARQHDLRLIHEQSPYSQFATEVITDAQRVAQILQNVICKVVTLARKGTDIKIEVWTDLPGIEGSLHFSVKFLGDERIDQIHAQEMFEETAGEGQQSLRQNLSMVVSKQICDVLRGQMRFETYPRGHSAFLFNVNCMNPSNLLRQESHTSQNFDEEHQKGNQEFKEIILVSTSVIDRLTVELISTELKIKNRLHIYVNIQEACQSIHDLYERSNGSEGFFMVIIDLACTEDHSSKVAQDFRRSMHERQVGYCPELVFLVSKLLQRNQIKLKKEMQKEIILCNPFSTRDFVQLFAKLQYQFEARPRSSRQSSKI